MSDSNVDCGEQNSNQGCIYWVREDDRSFIADPEGDGEIVNVPRLTAYAEYGEEIHDRHIHHEIPLVKIDAPEFLDALGPGDHRQIHSQDTEPVEVDGIPRLRVRA